MKQITPGSLMNLSAARDGLHVIIAVKRFKDLNRSSVFQSLFWNMCTSTGDLYDADEYITVQ